MCIEDFIASATTNLANCGIDNVDLLQMDATQTIT